MHNINYIKILKAKWQVVLLTTAVLMLLTIIISLLQPFEYGSRVGILIIQKQSLNLDAYAASRASERLASALANVIKTDSFFNKVLNNSEFKIQVEWPEKESSRRKFWQKMIKTQISPETGILTIDVFYKNKNQAKIISQSIANVLVNNAAEYHGGGDSVLVKVVDPALVSNYPARPNLIFNVLSALVAGVLLGSGMAIYQENNPEQLWTRNQEIKKIQAVVEKFDEEMEN